MEQRQIDGLEISLFFYRKVMFKFHSSFRKCNSCGIHQILWLCIWKNPRAEVIQLENIPSRSSCVFPTGWTYKSICPHQFLQAPVSRCPLVEPKQHSWDFPIGNLLNSARIGGGPATSCVGKPQRCLKWKQGFFSAFFCETKACLAHDGG